MCYVVLRLSDAALSPLLEVLTRRKPPHTCTSAARMAQCLAWCCGDLYQSSVSPMLVQAVEQRGMVAATALVTAAAAPPTAQLPGPQPLQPLPRGSSDAATGAGATAGAASLLGFAVVEAHRGEVLALRSGTAVNMMRLLSLVPVLRRTASLALAAAAGGADTAPTTADAGEGAATFFVHRGASAATEAGASASYSGGSGQAGVMSGTGGAGAGARVALLPSILHIRGAQTALSIVDCEGFSLLVLARLPNDNNATSAGGCGWDTAAREAAVAAHLLALKLAVQATLLALDRAGLRLPPARPAAGASGMRRP